MSQSNFVNYQRGNITFDYDATKHKFKNVLWNKKDLAGEILSILAKTRINPKYAFTASAWRVRFDTSIIPLCNNVFDAIKEIKIQDQDEILAAYFASYTFGFFAQHCFSEYLDTNQHMIGIGFWQSLLLIIKNWEDSNNPITIHKGTLFFFLAENYLIIGDRDSGFVYLYNAIEDDKKLTAIGYPSKAPAYMTATISDDSHNHMFFLVRELRLFLGNYISKFRQNYNSNFKMIDVDTKFLREVQLNNIVFFFVSNLLYFFDEERNTRRELLNNDFSRLKTLDLFFNLGLIIDEILRYSYHKHTGNVINDMNEGVSWLCDRNNWMSVADVQNFWGSSYLRINSDNSDIVIPKLLQKTEKYNQNIVPNEVFVIFTAYHLRNFAGHNITQQQVLSSNYDEILEQLFMALFLAIDSL